VSAETGDTALNSMRPGLDMLYALLKLAGADVTARNNKNETPLHCAVARGDQNLMRLLLLDACDANAVRTDGQTPLHLAAACEIADVRMGLVRSLVKSNADLGIRDARGVLAIDVARAAPDPCAVVVRPPHTCVDTYVPHVVCTCAHWVCFCAPWDALLHTQQRATVETPV
jgi:hypothetical protein